MKQILITIFLTLSIISANENWIEIKSISNTSTSKPNLRLDINLSKIKSIQSNKINLLLQSTTVKQLVDLSNKRKIEPSNSNNWFALDKPAASK